MSVQVLMNGPNRLAFFRQLSEVKSEIETEVGSPLIWLENPEKQESHIRLTREGIDLNAREHWPDLLRWMRENLERFHAAFSARARELAGIDVGVDVDAG